MTATAKETGLGVVYWEDDPNRTRTVKAMCKVCSGISLIDVVWLVSKNGIAHHAEGDITLCGKDATGPEWWWRW